MSKKRSVLITGTSTGIGRSCALLLDKEGFKIYAGVRKKEDFERLSSDGSGNIQPVMLDVRKDEDVMAVVKTISEDQENSFYGLVNNAGVGISGILEAIPVEEIIKVFEVNLFGLHRITKELLPIIRNNQGRVINIGSSSSFLSGPALGPYAGSKFALRAYTDALRMEMKDFNVKVSLVAPGPVESAIWHKAQVYKEGIRKTVKPELLETYKMFVKAGDKILDSIHPIPAIHVANAVRHALISVRPKEVYLVGKNAKMARILSYLPNSWSDYLFLKRLQKMAGNTK